MYGSTVGVSGSGHTPFEEVPRRARRPSRLIIFGGAALSVMFITAVLLMTNDTPNVPKNQVNQGFTEESFASKEDHDKVMHEKKEEGKKEEEKKKDEKKDRSKDDKEEEAKKKRAEEEEEEIEREDRNICKKWHSEKVLKKGHTLARCEKEGLERVRAAFQDENCGVARSSVEAAKEVGGKIKKLAEESVFVFFRGAASFFAYDLACTLKEFEKRALEPHVTSNGDCHPENFGVMEMANEKLVWAVNDFDNAYNTPFDWDVRRGATGFRLACDTLKMGSCDEHVEAFVDGYLSQYTDCKFTNDDRFLEGTRATDDYPVIASLFRGIRHKRDNKRIKWLSKKVDLQTRKFRYSDELVSVPDEKIPEFQEAIENYLYHGVSALVDHPAVDGYYKILDIAEKKGSGTGSVGLKRYWLLMQGNITLKEGNFILEMKEEADSVVERYSVNSDTTRVQEAARVVQGEKSSLPFADLYYGWVMYRDAPFLIRERNIYKAGVDLEKLNGTAFRQYSEASGKALAHFHMKVSCQEKSCPPREAASVDTELCENIVEYLKGEHKLKDEILQWSKDEAKRQIEGHTLLRKHYETDKKMHRNPVTFLD